MDLRQQALIFYKFSLLTRRKYIQSHRQICLFPSSSFAQIAHGEAKFSPRLPCCLWWIQAGFLPLVKRPEKYAFIEKNSEKMCGKYFITREEKEKGWQEIMAILQRRGEPFKTSENF